MEMKLKVMNYNILNGFCGYKFPFKIDKKRLDFVSEIINKENPDILILCECFFWSFSKKDSLINIKKTFEKMYNLYAVTSHNPRWAPVILSKFKIKKSDSSLSKYGFNFLRTEIDIRGKTLFLDVFHPSPIIRDIEKINFFKPLLKKIPKNYVLAGDFNSLSDEDGYDKEKVRRVLSKIMNEKDREKILKSLLDMRFITFLRRNKLNDVMKKFDDSSTIPTNLIDKKKRSPLRIDYFFTSKELKVNNARVIKNKLTEKASDHYPITALVEIK